MAGRTFAQINGTILKSHKLKSVNHVERWVYLCAHFTPLSQFSGVFNYPTVMWASDAGLSMEDFEAALTRLVEVGLVEWSPEPELVRIISFHRQRPPENASRSKSLVIDFEDLLQRHYMESGPVLRAAAEFIVAAVDRSMRWKPDSKDRPLLRDTLRGFMLSTHAEHEEAFLEALHAEIRNARNAVKGEVASMLPPLSAYLQRTVPTRCLDHADTRDEDETRRREDEYKNEDSDGATLTTSLRSGDPKRCEPVNMQRTDKATAVGVPASAVRESTKLSPIAQASRG